MCFFQLTAKKLVDALLVSSQLFHCLIMALFYTRILYGMPCDFVFGGNHHFYLIAVLVRRLFLLTITCGRFSSDMHNKLHNIMAALISKACCNVSAEPTLQLLTGEVLSYLSANVKNG